jgi:hypothetical protein
MICDSSNDVRFKQCFVMLRDVSGPDTIFALLAAYYESFALSKAFLDLK